MVSYKSYVYLYWYCCPPFFRPRRPLLVTVNRLWLKSLADQGHKRAGTVLKVVEDQGKMLSAILIGNNVVNLGASALMTVFVTRLWGEAAVGLATGVLTLLILVFGEISPKNAGRLFMRINCPWPMRR